jgi:DNA damage-inducible protein 1
MSGLGPSNSFPYEEDDDLVHVACEIGNVAVEMMVDTGAQSSVISKSLAQRLGLMRFLDSSRQGIASGVGTARILGRLPGIQVKLGHVEFAMDFTVLDVEEQLLMLGIDQMKKYKCIVDLERKCIVFGGRNGCEVPFLPPSPSRFSIRRACPTM